VHYSPIERYLLRTYGFYWRAFAHGRFEPSSPAEVHFLSVARGQEPPSNDVENAWTKFVADYPELAYAQDQE
jgi:uncharacterized protein YifE (UPF0438 family)